MPFWEVKEEIWYCDCSQKLQNSRNFLPTKISSLTVIYPSWLSEMAFLTDYSFFEWCVHSKTFRNFHFWILMILHLVSWKHSFKTCVKTPISFIILLLDFFWNVMRWFSPFFACCIQLMVLKILTKEHIFVQKCISCFIFWLISNSFACFGVAGLNLISFFFFHFNIYHKCTFSGFRKCSLTI